MRIKRKFADIVPVMVGSVTLRAEAIHETTKKNSACVKFCGFHWPSANTVANAPETLIAVM
jgi:hypothetical protein